MPEYYVNRKAQQNGDHEVHKTGCRYMPKEDNRIYLGDLPSCFSAVVTAKKHFSQVNGCFYCSRECHTG